MWLRADLRIVSVPDKGGCFTRAASLSTMHTVRVTASANRGASSKMAALKDHAAAKRRAHQIQTPAYPRSPHTHRRHAGRFWLSRAEQHGHDDPSAKFPTLRPGLNLAKRHGPVSAHLCVSRGGDLEVAPKRRRHSRFPRASNRGQLIERRTCSQRNTPDGHS